MPARFAPIFMPAMMPLPSMVSGPISALGPYSIDGSTMRGSIMVRSGTLPCMPPVATITALRARMWIVLARSSILPLLPVAFQPRAGFGIHARRVARLDADHPAGERHARG